MLFTEDSMTAGNIDGLSILDESYYVDSEVATPTTVPVVENSDLGAAVVRFSDIESISESYGCDFIDAMEAVAEQNEIDPEYLAVAVDEARIIEEPELIYELANVVVSPQSENSLAYQFCEACLNDYIDSEGDETFLEAMIDEDVALEVYGALDEARASLMGLGALNTADKGVGNFLARSYGKLKGSALGRALGGNRQSLLNDERVAKRGLENAHNAFSQQVGDDIENAKAGYFNSTGRAKAVKAAADNVKTAGRAVAIRDKIDAAKRNKGKIGAGVAAGALAAGLAYKNRDKIKSALGKGKAAVAGATGNLQAASAGKLDKIVAAANNKPKSWISQKIAALRGMYSKWLQKAQAESDAGKASVIKKFAAKILACIDTLMKKLEHATA